MGDRQGDDEQPHHVVEEDIAELIPPGWHGHEIWVSSYRAYRLTQTELRATEPFDLLDVSCRFSGADRLTRPPACRECRTPTAVSVFTFGWEVHPLPRAQFLYLLPEPGRRRRSRRTRALGFGQFWRSCVLRLGCYGDRCDEHHFRLCGAIVGVALIAGPEATPTGCRANARTGPRH